MRLGWPVQPLMSIVAWELILAFVLAPYCLSKSLTYLRIDRPDIQKYLLLPNRDQTEQLRTLRILFKRANCDADILSAQSIPGEVLPNLVCVLPGTENQVNANTIIIGAGSDHEAEQSGRNLVMLPLLAASMNSVLHKSNLVFIAFAGSGGGQTGLSWYIEHLNAQERKHTSGALILKSIGASNPAYTLGTYASKRFEKYLALAAETLKLPHPAEVSTKDFAVLELDHQHLPGVTFDSLPVAPMAQFEELSEEKLPDLESSLQLQRFNDSYNLFCIYLLYLDDSFTSKHHRRAPSLPIKRAPVTR
jgi:hypothetical protein